MMKEGGGGGGGAVEAVEVGEEEGWLLVGVCARERRSQLSGSAKTAAARRESGRTAIIGRA